MGQGTAQETGQRSRQAERGSPLRYNNGGAATAAAAAAAAGPLSEDEVKALRAAYAAGARGAVLIGLRQVVRVVSVHLPEQTSEAESARQMGRAGARLRLLRCDGYIHVRRSLLRTSDRWREIGATGAIGSALQPALVIDEHIAPARAAGVGTGAEQRVVLLGPNPDPSEPSLPSRHLFLRCCQWRLHATARLTDAVSRALEQAFEQARR